MGGHTVAEVYYDNGWHFFDPTFGLLFYSHAAYDGTGTVLSLQALLADPSQGTLCKVLPRPWTGYSHEVRDYQVTTAEPGFMADWYGYSITTQYRDWVKHTFPVEFDPLQPSSHPIGADLAHADELVLSRTDAAPEVAAAFRIGPRHVHTLSLRLPADGYVAIEYTLTAHGAALELLPLKSMHVVSQHADNDRGVSSFTVRVTDTEAIGLLCCPSRSCPIDRIRIHRVSAGALAAR
jgi:hypothetical protein